MTTILAGVSWYRNCSRINFFFFLSTGQWEGTLFFFFFKVLSSHSCARPLQWLTWNEFVFGFLVAHSPQAWWLRQTQLMAFLQNTECQVFRMSSYTAFPRVTHCLWHSVLQKCHGVPKEWEVSKWLQNLREASAPLRRRLAFLQRQ